MLKKSNQDLVGILVLRELEREREECMSKWIRWMKTLDTLEKYLMII